MITVISRFDGDGNYSSRVVQGLLSPEAKVALADEVLTREDEALEFTELEVGSGFTSAQYGIYGSDTSEIVEF